MTHKSLVTRALRGSVNRDLDDDDDDDDDDDCRFDLYSALRKAPLLFRPPRTTTSSDIKEQRRVRWTETVGILLTQFLTVYVENLSQSRRL